MALGPEDEQLAIGRRKEVDLGLERADALPALLGRAQQLVIDLLGRAGPDELLEPVKDRLRRPSTGARASLGARLVRGA